MGVPRYGVVAAVDGAVSGAIRSYPLPTAPLSSLTGGVRWPVCSEKELDWELKWLFASPLFVCLEMWLLGGVADFETVDTRLSLPRPLMPLLLFLYRLAKYSHNSRSWPVRRSASVMLAKRRVRWRRLEAWNLF